MSYDEFIERRIVAGLAASQEFTEKLRPDFDLELIDSDDELRVVAGWCLDHFDQRGKVIGPQIDMLYMKNLKGKANPNTEAVLTRISHDIAEGRISDWELLYDHAVQYFQNRELRILAEQIDILTAQGRGDAAEELRRNFQPRTYGEEAIDTILAAELQVRKTDWLWQDRIPLGALCVLAGTKGMYKTGLLIDIAARVTTGREWPAGEGIAPQGRVLWIGVEDDWERTLLPRFLAAGGDRDRLEALKVEEQYLDKDGHLCYRLWDTRYVAKLRRVLDKRGDVKMIATDPIKDFMPYYVKDGDDKSVRGALIPPQRLAMEYQLSWIYTCHLNKSVELSGLERVSGSTAYVNVPRAGFVAVHDPADQHRRLLTPIPGNLARPMDALPYHIIEDEQRRPVVLWQNQTVNIDLDDVMKRVDPHIRSVLEEAAEWLQSELQDGPVPSEQIYKAGAKQGFSKDQLKTVKDRIGVRARKDGFNGPWIWEYNNTPLPSRPLRPSNKTTETNQQKMAEFSKEREGRDQERQEREGSQEREVKKVYKAGKSRWTNKLRANARQQRARLDDVG